MLFLLVNVSLIFLGLHDGCASIFQGELNEAMESIKISGKEEVQRLNEEQQQKLKEFDVSWGYI